MTDERELLSEVLDEQEETFIQQFYANEKMREAVKKVLLFPLYVQGTLKKGKKATPNFNWLFNSVGNTNENLGAVIRAKIEALNLVQEGFERLSKVKKEIPRSNLLINPAR